MRKTYGKKDEGFITQIVTFTKSIKSFEIANDVHMKQYSALIENFKSHY